MQTKSVQHELARLRGVFLSELAKRYESLGQRLQEGICTTPEISKLEDSIAQLAQMAGCAATFGFYDLHEVACKFETEMSAFSASTHRGKRAVKRLQSLQDDLNRIVQQTHDNTTRRVTGFQPTASQQALDLQVQHRQLEIVLFSADPGSSSELAELLGSRGYSVKRYHDKSSVESAARNTQIAAIIVDLSFFDDVSQAFQVATELQTGRPNKAGLIFISSQENNEFRISAARCGADAFFCRPINIQSLSAALDVVLEMHARNNDSRILLVEEDSLQAEYYSLLFRSRGMNVSVVSNTDTLSEQLLQIKPESIVIDYNISGVECTVIVRLIRLHEAYFNVPVIVLGHQTDASQINRVMLAGADDFVLKNAGDEAVLQTLNDRMMRHRRATSLINTDSLTGILNRGAFLDRAREEMMQLNRRQECAGLAMVDIDFFKQINDQHGHLVGDFVLRQVSDYLHSSLRCSDLLGRFAGDEFVIFLPNTHLADARKLLSRLCAGLAERKHETGGSILTVTLSIGLIEIHPDCGEKIDVLLSRVDQALYRAKKSGRNQVAVEPPGIADVTVYANNT